MFRKKNRWKLLAPALIVLALAAAFVFGDRNIPEPKTPAEQPAVSAAVGSASEQGTEQAETPESEAPAESDAEETLRLPDTPQTDESAQTGFEQTEHLSPEDAQTDGTDKYETVNGMEIDTDTGTDKYRTDPVPEGKPIPVEPEDVTVGSAEYSCTLSISCSTILDNMDLCDPEKAELVPEDGWVLKPVTVTFYEGESVFDILQRTCKQQKLHMEFENTPIYNSAYIEGIHNLYEFDVGAYSGWMYKVNGWFPNYGCSRYQLKDGDVIEWVYTCDLGKDVGGGYATGSE